MSAEYEPCPVMVFGEKCVNPVQRGERWCGTHLGHMRRFGFFLPNMALRKKYVREFVAELHGRDYDPVDAQRKLGKLMNQSGKCSPLETLEVSTDDVSMRDSHSVQIANGHDPSVGKKLEKERKKFYKFPKSRLSVVDRALRHIQSVEEKPKFHCERAKQAVVRFAELADRYDFLPDKVEEVGEFIERMPIPIGMQWAGKRYELMDYQCFILAHVYGLYVDEDERLTKECLLMVPKKNGKTGFFAMLGGYHLLVDGGEKRNAPLVMYVATQKSQAAVGYQMLYKSVVKQPQWWLDENGVALGRTKHDATEGFKEKNALGEVKIVPKNIGAKHDGLLPSFVLVDELHGLGHGDTTYGIFKKGVEHVYNGIMAGTSTAGDDTQSVGYAMTLLARDIFDGQFDDDAHACFLWEPDEEDDPWDVRTLYKTNPGMGVTNNSRHLIRSQKLAARGDVKERREFMAKNLNMWVPNRMAFLETESLSKCVFSRKEFNPAENPVSVGIDLSVVNDFTAITFSYEEMDADGVVRVKSFSRIFATRAKIDTKEKWQDWNSTKPTPKPKFGKPEFPWLEEGGQVKMDLRRVRDIVVHAKEELGWNISSVAYDSFEGEMLSSELQEALEDVVVVRLSLTSKIFTGPMELMHGLVEAGEYRFVENECFFWCCLNTLQQVGRNENGVHPVKESVDKKIDACVSQLMALYMMRTKVVVQKPGKPEKRKVKIVFPVPEEAA